MRSVSVHELYPSPQGKVPRGSCAGSVMWAENMARGCQNAAKSSQVTCSTIKPWGFAFCFPAEPVQGQQSHCSEIQNCFRLVNVYLVHLPPCSTPLATAILLKISLRICKGLCDSSAVSWIHESTFKIYCSHQFLRASILWHLKTFEFVSWLDAGSSFPFPAVPKSPFSFNSPNPVYL